MWGPIWNLRWPTNTNCHVKRDSYWNLKPVPNSTLTITIRHHVRLLRQGETKRLSRHHYPPRSTAWYFKLKGLTLLQLATRRYKGKIAGLGQYGGQWLTRYPGYGQDTEQNFDEGTGWAGNQGFRPVPDKNITKMLPKTGNCKCWPALPATNPQKIIELADLAVRKQLASLGIGGLQEQNTMKLFFLTAHQSSLSHSTETENSWKLN